MRKVAHVWRRTARELSMASIHLPDGAFSILFLIFWWILAAVLITTTSSSRAGRDLLAIMHIQKGQDNEEN